MSTAARKKTPPLVDAAAVERFARIMLQANGVAEVRALDATTAVDRRSAVHSGYFNNAAALADEVAKIRAAKGVYCTLNSVDESLLGRSFNRLKLCGRTATTADTNIVRRKFMLIDCDPVRAADISSSDEEHELAGERALKIRDWLQLRGWPECLFGDSGNGFHLLFAIDLPTDDGGLVQKCLETVAERFDDAAIKIDRGVYNASRITRCFGVTNCKGDIDAAAIGRPQRMAKLLEAPEPLEVVSVDLLEALAAEAPAEPQPIPSTNEYHGRFNIDEFIAKSGLKLRGPLQYQGGRKWVGECPWNDQHTGEPFFIIERANGVLQAGCPHNSCKGNDWHKLRDLVEPNRRRRHDYQSNGRPLPQECEVYDEPPPVEPFEQCGINTGGSGDASAHSSTKDRPRIEYKVYTCAELDRAEFQIEYLVKHTVASHQPLLIAGGKKSLKTSVLLDLGISISTAGYFLGKLKCTRAARMAIFSGESGISTIQETLRRQSEAAGLRLSDIAGLIVSPDLPRFGSIDHQDALRKFFTDNEIEIAAFDPSYLCLDTDGNEASLFAMGTKLRAINDVCQSVGVQLILCHHTKRGVVNPFQPPELEDVAFAGFQEWCRQWLLLGRREKYEPGTGEHKLWMNCGGSMGHSSLWALDIREGVFDGTTPRRWEVELLPAADARQQAHQTEAQRRSEAAAQRNAAQLEADRTTLVRVMVKHPTGETKSVLKGQTGLRQGRIDAALASLLADATVEPCQITRANKQTYDGYRIKESTNFET